jgi:hypothetical protein
MGTPVREEAIQLIQKMPDDCTLKDILCELYLEQKVGRSLRDTKEGRIVNHREVKHRACILRLPRADLSRQDRNMLCSK